MPGPPGPPGPRGSPAAVLITRRDRVEFVNPAATLLLATPADQLVGRTTGELFADDSHKEVVAQVDQLKPEHGLTGPVVGRLARPDGTSPRVELTATALAADKAPGILWFLRDLDEPTDDQRRVTEAALVASQQRLQLFVEYAPAALAMFDLDMRYIVASRRWRADYQLPDTDLTGRSHYDLCPEVSTEWKAVHQRALGGETVTADEDLFVRADGSSQWLQWEVRPWREADGTVGGVVVFTEDVTERKRAEDELRESRARLELAQHAGRIGIFDWDIAAGRSVWTEAQEAVFGLPPGGFEGTHEAWARRVHPADRGQFEAVLAGCLARRKPDCEFDYRIVRVDGEVRWVSNRGMITYAPDGRPLRVIGTTVDITDRKRFEEQLRDREQRFQAVLDTATDGIITIDDRGIVESVNPATERLFGYSSYELVGRNVSALMPPPYAAEHDGYIARYLRTGERRIIGFGREVTGRRKDGTVFPMELAVVEISGPPRRFTGFVRDITDRKQLEARFLRAQRLESLGSLASGVAHDLNNVLTPVLMAVKLLLKDKPGGQRQAILETALASVERGTGIVRQLLAFGGGVYGEKEPVAAADVVREVIGMMEHTLPKSITLTAHLPADLWPVTGDVTQLSQLLVNLCVNARDAMPTGGQIRISAENFPVDTLYATRYPGAKPGRYVLLTVADTGPGIPPAVQERMFDPFFTTKPFGQGTGLGLATVQGIVKAHGGFVTVYSEAGRGAKFLIHLPAGGLATQPTEESERPTSLPGQGRLVLVVDDEPAVRLMARATLEAVGYRVIDASDGEAALAAYRVGEVAAVVLDMMMPGLDTPTVIRRLRQLDPSARILAVSGLHPSGHAAAVLKEFAIPFLSKPYTDDAVLTALDRLHSTAPS